MHREPGLRAPQPSAERQAVTREEQIFGKTSRKQNKEFTKKMTITYTARGTWC